MSRRHCLCSNHNSHRCIEHEYVGSRKAEAMVPLCPLPRHTRYPLIECVSGTASRTRTDRLYGDLYALPQDCRPPSVYASRHLRFPSCAGASAFLPPPFVHHGKIVGIGGLGWTFWRAAAAWVEDYALKGDLVDS